MATTTETSPVAPGFRAVLGHPRHRAVFVAHAVSMLGSVAAEVALSVLVFERTGSAFLSSLVLTVSFLPYALGGVALSSVADRFPARPVLVTCDLICAASVAAMLVPGLPVGVMLALLLVVGLISPVFQGTRAASLSIMLGPEKFPVGRALLRTVSQSALVTGLAVGSVALALIGPTWMLAADAVSFLASAALLRFRSPATPAPASLRRTGAAADSGGSSAAGSTTSTDDGPRPRARLFRESLVGLRYLAGSSPLRWLVLLGWSAPTFSMAAEGLAAAYAVHAGSVASSAAVLLTGGAAGSVLGEIVGVRLPARWRRTALLPLLLLTQLPMVAFVATPPVAVAAALLVLAGAGFAYNQGLDPLVLAAIDPEFRGRAFTVQSSGLMAAQGAGAGLAGLLGTFVSPSLVIAAAGVLGVVCMLALSSAALRPAPRQGAPVSDGPVAAT